MKDYFIIILSIYITITSIFTILFFSDIKPSNITTSIEQLVIRNTKYKVILLSGEEIVTSNLTTYKDHISINDNTGIQLTLEKSFIQEITQEPYLKKDNRILHLGTIKKEKKSYLKDIFAASDTMWLFWIILILTISLKKNLNAWQGWIIASSFCIIQSMFTTLILRKNVGSTFLAIPNIPSIINYLFPNTNMTYFFIIQTSIIIIIPTLILYLTATLLMRVKIKNLKNESIQQ